MADVQESKQKKKFVKLYEKHKLSPTEELIFKPYEENWLRRLTRKEIEEYLSLDIKALRKTKINMKTIVIAEETQKFLIEHKEEILKRIKLNSLKCSQYSKKEEDEYAK